MPKKSKKLVAKPARLHKPAQKAEQEVSIEKLPTQPIEVSVENNSSESKVFEKRRKFEKLRTRNIYSLIMLAIIIPFVAIVQYTGITGRVIGFIGYTTLGGFAVLELVKYLEFNKYSRIYILVLFFLAMFFEYEQTRVLIGVGNTNINQIGHIINLYSLGIPLLALTLLFVLESKSFSLVKFLYICFIIIVVTIFARTMLYTNVIDFKIFCFIPLVSIISDSCAYFGGFLFGKHKIFPKISPNKTWEGAIAGFVACLIFVAIYGHFAHVFKDTRNETVALVFATLLLPIVSQAGDVGFSQIKRGLGIKDFSSLIPGHGGILDRIDSHIFVCIAFTIIFATAGNFLMLGL